MKTVGSEALYCTHLQIICVDHTSLSMVYTKHEFWANGR